MLAPITSLAFSQDSVFAAAADFVGRYVRGKEVGRMVLALPSSSSSASTSSGSSSSSSESGSDSDSDDEMDEPKETLTNVIIFGSTLVALSASGARMYVWDIPAFINPASKVATGESIVTTPYTTIDFANGFRASRVVHPATYLNKVVVAGRDGSLALWNIRTG